jgi:hypothetical protein
MTRESTRLGNTLGHAARAVVIVMDYALPLAVIGTYRMIPADARGRLFGGPSASLTAMRLLRAQRGGGWEIIRIAMTNHPDTA